MLPFIGLVWRFPDTWSNLILSRTKNPAVVLPSPYVTEYSQGIPVLQSEDKALKVAEQKSWSQEIDLPVLEVFKS